METKILRKIIRIDDDKCDGCGMCVTACAEGAIQIIDGKAKLISERFCDGLGACLGECPQDAITIEEREAEEFDEEAVQQHLQESQPLEDVLPCACPGAAVRQFEIEELPCGCPSTAVTHLGTQDEATANTIDASPRRSMLRHWPVQLTLVPPTAPFLQDADLLLAADCIPFAYADFHRDLLKDYTLLVACPKLDDFPAHLRKLTNILGNSRVKSLTVAHMEVPCCSGLVHMAQQAIEASGKHIPLKTINIGIKGDLLN